MKKVFDVGHSYEANDRGFDPIKILRRTPKYVVVTTNGRHTWRMLVRIDDRGDEYVVDSSVPKKWQDVMTYQAKWSVE